MTDHPRNTLDMLGHGDAEISLRGLIHAERLPHALILAGDPGIGKATLAYRLARYLLARTSDRHSETLEVTATAISARLIGGGAHPDLIGIEREISETTGALSKEIAVENIRKIAPFLRMTSTDNNWRVAIIDDASAMNRAGQNALLKILEEPPKKSVLILVADRPGVLLPTIHSRSQVVRLKRLDEASIKILLQKYHPDLSDDDLTTLAELSEGSIGRALQLVEEEGVSLYHEISALLNNLPRLDRAAVHAFSERLGAAAAINAYRLTGDLLGLWLLRRMRTTRDRLDRWVAACDKINARFSITDSVNLDRKLAVWSAFEWLAEAAQ